MSSRNLTATIAISALILAALFALVISFDHGAGTYCAQACAR